MPSLPVQHPRVKALFDALEPIDTAVARVVDAAATPALVEAMTVLSAAHTARGMAVLVIGAVALLLALRDRVGALWLPLTYYSGATLNHGLKHLVGRPRPGQEGLLLPTDFAFPSGHAAQATLLYGALVLLLWRQIRSPTARAAAVVAASVAVGLVAASRLVLRTHWFSDVVAGVAVGGAWLALCVALRALQRR
jgi:membrane-associated phospholipid phosphatase